MEFNARVRKCLAEATRHVRRCVSVAACDSDVGTVELHPCVPQDVVKIGDAEYVMLYADAVDSQWIRVLGAQGPYSSDCH